MNSLSLFHVVHIALNVVSTKRLAWQERKAKSFTVSPRHCGAASGLPRKRKLWRQDQRQKQQWPVARDRNGHFGRGRQPQYGLPFFAVDCAVADAVQRAIRLVAR